MDEVERSKYQKPKPQPPKQQPKKIQSQTGSILLTFLTLQDLSNISEFVSVFVFNCIFLS